MSYQPSAPPPSYNAVLEKGESNSTAPTNGFQSSPANSAPYNNSQVPMHQTQTQLPIQTQPQPQIIVVQGGPMTFGPHAQRLICPSCNQNTVTRIEYKTSAATHVLAGILCFTGCCCLAPIPYFVDACKNSIHYCSDCGNYLGTYANGGSSRHRRYGDNY